MFFFLIKKKQSLYEKLHHNIIYCSLNFNIHLPPPSFREEKPWILKMPKLNLLKKQYQTLTGQGLSIINIPKESVKF